MSHCNHKLKMIPISRNEKWCDGHNCINNTAIRNYAWHCTSGCDFDLCNDCCSEYQKCDNGAEQRGNSNVSPDDESYQSSRSNDEDSTATTSTRKKWQPREHSLFVEGLEKFGRKWDLIAKHIGNTRPKKSVSSHANYYFLQLLEKRQKLPDKVLESGYGYSLSGKPLNKYSPTAIHFFGSADNVPDMDGVISDPENVRKYQSVKKSRKKNRHKQSVKKNNNCAKPKSFPHHIIIISDEHDDDEIEILLNKNNTNIKHEKNNGKTNIKKEYNENLLQSQGKRKRKKSNDKKTIEYVSIISDDDDDKKEVSPPKKRRKLNENGNIKCEKYFNLVEINGVNIKEGYNNNGMDLHYTKWTGERIVIWLTELENGAFKAYGPRLLRIFQEREVCGDDLNEVDKTDLQEWGITKFGHYKRILKHIHNLTDENV